MISLEIKILNINERLRQTLPESYQILSEANLTVHPYVTQVFLVGSRGAANCYRADSDIDLSLVVDMEMLHRSGDQEKTLRDIVNTTLNNWKSPVEVDIAAVFDINSCHLRCLCEDFSPDKICQGQGIDCLGIYKTQKGFNGYVPKIGVLIERLHPMISVWKRPFTSKI